MGGIISAAMVIGYVCGTATGASRVSRQEPPPGAAIAPIAIAGIQPRRAHAPITAESTITSARSRESPFLPNQARCLSSRFPQTTSAGRGIGWPQVVARLHRASIEGTDGYAKSRRGGGIETSEGNE